MTMTLSHLTDLQRVRIALSDRADGTVLVERSATAGFQLPSTARGGVALPISGGVGQLDDYEFYADVQNWYRVTPIDPAGLLLPGTSGAFASTPDAAPLDIVGDLDVRAEVDPTTEVPATVNTIAARWVTTGNQRAWRFSLHTSGALRLNFSNDGTTIHTVTSTASPVWPASGRLAVRATLDVDNGSAGRTVTFFTAPSIAGPWTVLGDPIVTAGTVVLFAGTSSLEVGSFQGGVSELFAGTVYSLEVRDGIDGTLVASPDFPAQTDGTASFADSAGRTWTVNRAAEIVGVEIDSITPSLAGQVWLKSVRYPLQNTAVRVSDYGDIQIPSRAAAFPVEGRALPTGVFELGLGRDHTLILRTTDQATEDHLKLMVRTGDWFYIHVPTVAANGQEGNLLLPGSMYVLMGTPTIHRIGGVSAQHLISIPLTEVTAPGPDVVGTTLTVGGLVALHGTVESVWAAYPTIRDSWDTIGSLDDLVVI